MYSNDPPPRGHTSIYLCDHLKNNWNDFKLFRTAKGLSSLNAYANNTMVLDYTHNYDKIMGKKKMYVPKKPNMYDDTLSKIKEKLLSLSDGEILDIINDVSDYRNILIREAKKRGTKP